MRSKGLKRLSIIILLICLLGGVALSSSTSRVSYTVSVEAQYELRDVPVSAVVPLPGVPYKSVVLKTKAGQIVPHQCEYASDGVRVTWMIRHLKKGERQQYTVVFTKEAIPLARDAVKVVQSDESVNIRINGLPFMNYVFKGAPKPYCYPIFGPNKIAVTRGYPMDAIPGEDTDHPHHRSLWFTHGDVNGIDFWGESPQAGRIVHRKFDALENGPVYGRIVAVNDWVTRDGKKVCEDRREIRVYNALSCRMMDIEVTVRATDSPVRFGDTKEGTFGIRVASWMDADKGGEILNSRGDRGAEAWGKQADWCDYFGKIGNDMVGIAVLEHPSSFRHPTYWHVRTYGLFAANPFGLRDFRKDKTLDGSYTIPPGGEITFRYRIVIHKGDADKAGIASAYLAYAEQPTVSVVKCSED